HQPAHRVQVAQALPAGRRAGLARSQLAPDEDTHELGRCTVRVHRAVAPLAHAHAPVATIIGRSVSTVSRLLARLGLSSLKALDPIVPAIRYEREAPGELLHIDTKKLGRIVHPSHRV